MIFPALQEIAAGFRQVKSRLSCRGNSVSRRADYSRHADVVVSSYPNQMGHLVIALLLAWGGTLSSCYSLRYFYVCWARKG